MVKREVACTRLVWFPNPLTATHFQSQMGTMSRLRDSMDHERCCDRRDGGTLPKDMTRVSVVPLWQYFSEDHILNSLRKEYIRINGQR